MVSNEELKSPLNAIQQLMAITSEEAGELTQVCMKVMRKYTTLEEIQNDKYRNLLIEEAGDVLCMIELMVEHGVLTDAELSARVKVKRNKLKTWSNLINRARDERKFKAKVSEDQEVADYIETLENRIKYLEYKMQDWLEQ